MYSIYFAAESITTVGLGDYHPTTDASRLFTIPFLIIGCTMMLNFFITFSRTYLTDCHDEIIYQIRRLRGLADQPVTPVQMSIYRVFFSVFTVLIAVLVGALFYTNNEGWTFVYAIYFCTIIMTSVGYGK